MKALFLVIYMFLQSVKYSQQCFNSSLLEPISLCYRNKAAHVCSLTKRYTVGWSPLISYLDITKVDAVSAIMKG